MNSLVFCCLCVVLYALYVGCFVFYCLFANFLFVFKNTP